MKLIEKIRSLREGSNDEIRNIILKLNKNSKVKKANYDKKGIQIIWSDGEISGTMATGDRGLKWLKDVLKVENIKINKR